MESEAHEDLRLFQLSEKTTPHRPETDRHDGKWARAKTLALVTCPSQPQRDPCHTHNNSDGRGPMTTNGARTQRNST